MAERTYTVDQRRVVQYSIGISFAVVALMALAVAYLPYGVDWDLTYGKATRDVFSGRSPYEGDSIFYSPPWTAIPLVPFAPAPLEVGRAAVFLVAVLSYAYVFYWLGGRPAGIVAFLVSPFLVHGLINANVDWLVLLGVTLPPRWGIFFILVKPQVAVGVALFWLVEAWRDGGWRGVVATFAPVTAALLLTFILYGFWPAHGLNAPGYHNNRSLFPWSVPFGLALMWLAIRQRDVKPALAASPLLAPYVLLHSWCGVLLALAGRPRLAVWAVILSWVGFGLAMNIG